MSGADPPVVPSRVARSATWLIAAHVVFFLLFVAGGVLTIATAAHNGNVSVNCLGGFGPTCGHHESYVPGFTLIAVGFLGSLIVVAVGARLTIGYGLGALAYFQRRRMLMADSSPIGPADTGSPPGSPGSSTGPAL
jgi:hypothetical protein